jgi:hypothetical protein
MRTEHGVSAVAVSTSVPFQHIGPGTVTAPEGQSVGATYPVLFTLASRDYPEALGLRVIEGRWFEEGDYRSLTSTAVVSQSTARVIWGQRPPIGQCLIVASGACRAVIGVVGDTRRTSLTADPRPEVYLATVPEASTRAALPHALLVKASANTTTEMVRRRVLQTESALPYVSVQRLTDLLAPQLLPWRLGATAFALFGGLALVLTTIGVYGAIDAVIRARSREVGLRRALGAQGHHVWLFVLGRIGRAVMVGLALGLSGAISAGPALGDLLFAVSPRDASVLVVAAVTVALAALVATIPAVITALRVQPMDSMRQV